MVLSLQENEYYPSDSLYTPDHFRNLSPYSSLGKRHGLATGILSAMENIPISPWKSSPRRNHPHSFNSPESFEMDMNVFDLSSNFTPASKPSLADPIPIPFDSDPKEYFQYLHDLQQKAYEKKNEPLSLVMIAVSNEGEQFFNKKKNKKKNCNFHKEHTLGIYAFERPESLSVPFCYTALFQGFFHFTMLSSDVESLFKHHDHLDNEFKCHVKNTDEDMICDYFSAFYDLSKEKTLVEEATEAFHHLTNALADAGTFKADKLRSPSFIFTSGRTTQSGSQMKDTRRTACFPKSDPCTNNNSGKLVQNDLGVLIYEQVLRTLVVNASLQENPEKRLEQSFYIPDDPNGKNRVYKKVRLEERMHCAEDTIGSSRFHLVASQNFKNLAIRLCHLMGKNFDENNKLHTFFDYCNLVKEFLPEAVAIRPVDFTWNHFDLLGDPFVCPWTITLGCPVQISRIKKPAFVKALTRETRDPLSQTIPMMMALYGRKVSHDVANKMEKIDTKLADPSVDLITRLIARIVHEARGLEIDNLNLFEGEKSLQAILENKHAGLNRTATSVLNKFSKDCNVNPPNRCGWLCRSLDRIVSMIFENPIAIM